MLKIFCVYFDQRPLWKSDCVVPIQAGRKRTGFALDMLGDDTGDNISGENLRYGEMTAWYWVWKNYLPAHPELTHVGFSHYRRFLDFREGAVGRTRRMTYSRFRRIFASVFNEATVLKRLGDADIAMREPEPCGFSSIREHFRRWRPENLDDFDRFAEQVRAMCPERRAVIDSALSAPEIAMELQFVMTRECFEDFMAWSFRLCRACERQAPWGGARDGTHARVPAFLTERFFMVWLALKRAEGRRVRTFPMVKLTGRDWRYYLLKPFLPLMPTSFCERVYNRFK